MDQTSNQLSWWPADSPVKTSALPVQPASASSAPAPVSGRSLLEYCAKYSLDLRLLKMLLPFGIAGLPWSFKISGRSGLMRSGTVFRLQPLALLTRETESGSWPTLRACSGKRSSGANRTEMYNAMGRLPTLTARDWKDSRASEATLGKNSRPLNETVYAIARMATLTASTATWADIEQARYSGNDPRRPSYQEAKRMQTLTANRWSGLQSHGENAVLGPLNPEWCEWYMGFPIGWTELQRSGESSSPKSPSGSDVG